MVIRSIENKKLPLPGFEHLSLGFEPMGNSKQDIILQDLVVSCVDLTLVSFNFFATPSKHSVALKWSSYQTASYGTEMNPEMELDQKRQNNLSLPV